MGIALLPPDINHSQDCFTVEEAGIRFGLVAIKSIGRGFIQNVLREREENGLFTGLQDFCERMYSLDTGKRAVENLILAGAFDSFGVFRSRMVAVSSKLLDSIGETRRQNIDGQIDFFGMSQAASRKTSVKIPYPDIPEYPLEERMRQERDVTGLYLSGHPMNAYREAAARAGAVHIGAIHDDFAQDSGPVIYQDEQAVSVAGIVTAYRTRMTKNRTMMAYASIEDDTASIELICFSRTLERFGRQLSVGNAVLVRGKLTVRDEKPPQVICDEIYPLRGRGIQEPPPEQPPNVPVLEGKMLWLRLKGEEDPLRAHISRVISMFPGTTPVRLVFADTGKRMASSCLLGKSLVEEMIAVLGKENVVIQ